MCLAVPAEVVELLGDEAARVNMAGVLKTVSVALVPDVQLGEFVIVHVGHALARIDASEARATLELLAEAFPEDLSPGEGAR